MRNKIIFMVSAGSAALILAGAAMAQPPGYDPKTGWSVTNGDIAIDAASVCPATGWSCVTLVTDKGFIQRQLTELATGTLYFQTIVTDKTVSGAPATLPFYDSNLVRGGAVGGIIDSQRIFQPGSAQVPAGTTDFTATTDLKTGWAQASGLSEVTLNQLLNDQINRFDTSFALTQIADPLGAVVSKNLNLDQNVSLAVGGGATDSQKFILRERAGTIVSAPGSFTLPPIPGGTTNQTLAYAAGNDVKLIGIGQAVSIGTGQTLFGFQSYENLSPAPAAGLISTFSLTQKPLFDPSTYNAALFGTPAPTF